MQYVSWQKVLVFEQQHGDLEAVQDMYQQAMTHVTDYPAAVVKVRSLYLGLILLFPGKDMILLPLGLCQFPADQS